jgi:guanosine-3',5'-bis(diphosphate) 3'-pyrophosphohydrolase
VSDAPALLAALDFAARRHRDQRRKGAEATPYINHPIEVAHLLSGAGVTDPVTLQAALLHDTLEDTDTTPEELGSLFGDEVRRVVEEVTDDRRLPKEERKRLQTEHAPHLSPRAKLVKLGDKISNVRAIAHTPPAGWSDQRRREYLDWSDRVVAGCRGCNAALEHLYDQVIADARERLAGPGS